MVVVYSNSNNGDTRQLFHTYENKFCFIVDQIKHSQWKRASISNNKYDFSDLSDDSIITPQLECSRSYASSRGPQEKNLA